MNHLEDKLDEQKEEQRKLKRFHFQELENQFIDNLKEKLATKEKYLENCESSKKLT